jgi:hypothetical protein
MDTKRSPSLTDDKLQEMLEVAQSYPFARTRAGWIAPSQRPVRDILYEESTVEKIQALRRRIILSIRTLHPKDDDWLSQINRNSSRVELVRLAFMMLWKTHNTPDNEVSEGSIICFWDEDANYIKALYPDDVAAALSELQSRREVEKTESLG